jgi:hypothetical protein
MSIHPKARAALGLLAVALAGLAPAGAQAQAGADPWQWTGSIYGWLPSIGGSTSFPPQGGGPSIDVSSEQVIDSLKMTFMGSLGVKKGQWGLWTDLVYADFGASKQGTRDFTIGQHPLPGGVNGDLSLDLKTWIWTTAATYELASTPQYTADLLGGARMLDMAQKLNWTFNGDLAGTGLPGRSGSSNASGNFWDAVVGIKGQVYLGGERRWFIPYYADIGAGESQSTGQVMAGIGYRFEWGSLVAAWRYLDYQMKSGSPIQSLNLNGGLIGATFRW